MVNLTVKQTGTAIENKVYIGTTEAPIQQAIDYAETQGGGTIFIEKGRYVIAVPLKISKSNIKVHGEYSGTKLVPTFSISKGWDQNGVFKCMGAYGDPIECITIEALFIGAEDTSVYVGDTGIYCAYVGKALTAGLPTGEYDKSTSGSSYINDDGVRVLFDVKNGLTVKDCIIQGHYTYGIFVQFSSKCTITDNVIQKGRYGIKIYENGISNVISRNTIQNIENYLLSIGTGANNSYITENTFRNTGMPNFIMARVELRGDSFIFSNNTIQNTNVAGVVVPSSRKGTIHSNTFQNNSENALEIKESDNITITGNTFQHTELSSIVLTKSSYNVITANSIQYGGTPSIKLDAESNNNTITGNKYASIENLGTGNINELTHNQVV